MTRAAADRPRQAIIAATAISGQAIADARGKAWPARAVDISTGGIALVLERRFEPGAMLSTSLASSDGGDDLAIRVTATNRIVCRYGRPIKAEGDAGELGAAQRGVEGRQRLGEVAGVGQEMIGVAVTGNNVERLTEARVQRRLAPSPRDSTP